ncbi:MAG: aldehyde dehydrogenase family protein [Candidatus Riflebacteria bacterium]|nr:aldehyde dehydrogenase family protein [Candidatus Riflebacteria bacterium]
MNNIFKKFPFTITLNGGFSGSWFASGAKSSGYSPVDGRVLPEVTVNTSDDLGRIVTQCHETFPVWRKVPAPARGQIVREYGEEIRKYKEPLAQIITMEMGKPMRESLGEVQEVIDICDFAVGLSRQIGGPSLPSERKSHRMFEQWHPLGTIGVISAFNFPMAVWAWNMAIGMICGNTVLWKPSSKTPICAIVLTRIMEEILRKNNLPTAICSLVTGSGAAIGNMISSDERISMVSYTGSTNIGRQLGKIVQERFGKLILELGGNNASIVTSNADIDIALRSIYFGALGTAGQRCTSTRRVIIHEKIYDQLLSKLTDTYRKVKIGDPFESKNFLGPLVDRSAVKAMQNALVQVRKEGGKILYGGEKLSEKGGCYITPAIVVVSGNLPVVKEETFAPILYVMKFRELDEAISIHNDVPQGLSSSIITNNICESERFISECGSDCGIANVNTTTNGAEIGGAFGGEKATGGGRESGSDSWKGYMRRQTCTINYSGTIELAQGIQLDF